jgi:hypothetical protein
VFARDYSCLCAYQVRFAAAVQLAECSTTIEVSFSVQYNDNAAWSLTMREERRLKVFENWVLR